MLNDILTLCQQWLSKRWDFFQFNDLDTDLDFHRIMNGFHGAFAIGMASHQGTLTLSGHLIPSPFLGLCWDSSNLPYLYSTFHLEYPLVLSRFCFIRWKRLNCLYQVLKESREIESVKIESVIKHRSNQSSVLCLSKRRISIRIRMPNLHDLVSYHYATDKYDQ